MVGVTGWELRVIGRSWLRVVISLAIGWRLLVMRLIARVLRRPLVPDVAIIATCSAGLAIVAGVVTIAAPISASRPASLSAEA